MCLRVRLLRFLIISDSKRVSVQWLVRSGLKFWFRNTRETIKLEPYNQFQLQNPMYHFLGSPCRYIWNLLKFCSTPSPEAPPDSELSLLRISEYFGFQWQTFGRNSESPDVSIRPSQTKFGTAGQKSCFPQWKSVFSLRSGPGYVVIRTFVATMVLFGNFS